MVIIAGFQPGGSPAAKRADALSVGAEFTRAPPYSPDLNPIEQAFAKLKAPLHKAAKRPMPALWNTIGRLVSAFTPEVCAKITFVTQAMLQRDRRLHADLLRNQNGSAVRMSGPWPDEARAARNRIVARCPGQRHPTVILSLSILTLYFAPPAQQPSIRCHKHGIVHNGGRDDKAIGGISMQVF